MKNLIGGNMSGDPERCLTRALDILEIVSKTEGLTASQISKEVRLPQSTVFRLLSALVNRGYIERDKRGKVYTLSIKILELAGTLFQQMTLLKSAKPYLESLALESQETVHLAVLRDSEALYIDKEEGSKSIRVASQVGKRNPLHCTGVGKALMAYLPDEEIDRIIAEKGLKRYTSKTITAKTKLKKHLQLIKERGYTIDDGEHEDGVRCFAAPIRNYTGKVIASISMAGPDNRLREKDKELSDLTKKTAAQISERLGFVQR